MEHNELMLKAALSYREEFNLSIIPSGQDKKPLFTWKEYQDEAPSVAQINQWWGKECKGANISLVCGHVSNRIIVDIDKYKDPKALEAIEEITPESMLMPIVDTPRGGEHRHFLWDEKVKCSGDNDKSIDVKSEGGLAILPPSIFQGKPYQWRNGFNIRKLPTPLIPSSYIEFFYKYLYTSTSIINCNDHATPTNANNDQQTPTVNFNDGHRDHTLFHLANYLVKSGMNVKEIEQYLLFMGSHCNPPFEEKEIYTKIQSAIQRANVSEKGLTEAVRDLIRQHSGNITTTNLLQWTTNANNPQERKKIHVVMGRLEKEGLVRKTGIRAGEYRIVKKDIVQEDWKNAEVKSVPMVFPLGLHEAVRIAPSSIITFAGVTNSGKTALAMSMARLNCKNTVHYFSSEIRQDAFKRRAAAHSDLNLWNVNLYVGWNPNDLQDIIKPDGLNIIDYLEPPDGDYAKMATKLSDIQNALGTGIAIVCIQKKEGSTGVGGAYMINKPHLYCIMDLVEYPVYRLKILKCKDMQDGYRNPSGLTVDYKIARNGIDIVPFGKLRFERWDT